MNLRDKKAAPGPHQDGRAATAGKDAITQHLDQLYRGRKPKQYDNPHPFSAGGEDPLDAICVYWRAGPVPHWHFVTFGFSELYAKKSANRAASGHGFELTLRLAAAPGAAEPPIWPMHLLQSLARYVFKTGKGFQDGHRMSANGPISLGIPTRLCSMGFACDPELAPIGTPNGRVVFLQVVGMTLDEERAAQQWDTRKLLDLMQAHMPLWIIDLQRASLLPAVRASALAGLRTDGSSCGAANTDLLAVGEQQRWLRSALADVTLGARQIQQLVELLPLRLPFGRPFVLSGPAWQLSFELAGRNSWTIERRVLRLKVSRAAVQEFATLLQPRQGVYKLPSFQHIRWDVKKTTIRNAEGEIIDVIG